MRQKHSVSFPDLITEYGKVKRHSVEETVENDFVGICVVFGILLVFLTQIFQGNGNGRKWIVSERATNAMSAVKSHHLPR